MKKITRYIGQLANRIIRNGPAQTRTRHQDDDQVTVPSSSTALTSSLFPIRPGSTTLTTSRSKGTSICHVCRQIVKKLTNRRRCTSFAQLSVTAADQLDAMYYVGLVDTLDDDVILAIFDYCVSQSHYDDSEEISAWQTLVHVCHRWRIIVFESPRRLKLRLVCTNTTPVDRLDIWPPFPLYIRCLRTREEESSENVLALLERSNRVYRIDLAVFSSLDFERSVNKCNRSKISSHC